MSPADRHSWLVPGLAAAQHGRAEFGKREKHDNYKDSQRKEFD
jgi:hypothetical protein